MKVEVFHGDHLGVATTCCATFNPKSRALGWLPEAGESVAVLLGSQGLHEAHCRRALSFSKWGGGDSNRKMTVTNKFPTPNLVLTRQQRCTSQVVDLRSDSAPLMKFSPFCTHTATLPKDTIRFLQPIG